MNNVGEELGALDEPSRSDLAALQGLVCAYYQPGLLMSAVVGFEKISRTSMAQKTGVHPNTYGKRPGRQASSIERKREQLEKRLLQRFVEQMSQLGVALDEGEVASLVKRHTARDGYVGQVLALFLLAHLYYGSHELSLDAFLEGSLAMRLARGYDQESEALLEPLGRYIEDLPEPGSAEASVALVNLGQKINAMLEDRWLPEDEAPVEATNAAGLAQRLGIAMAHRWLRLAAAMEVEDWRLRHPGVAPAPVGQRLLWSSRSDPKRAPGRVLTWLWLGFGYVEQRGGITHASQVSYRDLIPDEAALEVAGYQSHSLNENPLRWMERHGSGDQPLSFEKLTALTTAWGYSKSLAGEPVFAPVTWWAIGVCAIRAERWLGMLPSVTVADYFRYWEEARLKTEKASAPDSTLAVAPIWMQSELESLSAH